MTQWVVHSVNTSYTPAKVQLDSSGNITILGPGGKRLGITIDGANHGLAGAIDTKVVSFSLSYTPKEPGIIEVSWDIGIKGGIFSGGYGELTVYDISGTNFYKAADFMLDGPSENTMEALCRSGLEEC